jgi:hypothetical protein
LYVSILIQCAIVGDGGWYRGKRGSPRLESLNKRNCESGKLFDAELLVEAVLECMQSMFLTFSMLLSSVVVGGCRLTVVEEVENPPAAGA